MLRGQACAVGVETQHQQALRVRLLQPRQSHAVLLVMMPVHLQQAIPSTREEYDAFMMGYQAANGLLPGVPARPSAARTRSPQLPLQLPQPRQPSFQERLAPSAAREYESMPAARSTSR